MKKLALAMILSFAAVSSHAQTAQPIKVEAANAATAMLVGWFVLPAALITGKTKQLCDLFGGKYDPQAADICVGGNWVKVWTLIPQPEAKK